MSDVVLWSGGFDSTLVLSQRAKKSSKDNPVFAISVKHQELGIGQWKMEQKARKRLLAVFKRRGYFIKHYVIETRAHEGNNPKNLLLSQRKESLYQPAWWLFSVLDFLREGDKLYLGYHLGDSFWALNKHYVDAFLSGCRLMGKHCKLHFPLRKWSKQTIISELKKEKLFDVCWTCDNPQRRKPCKVCKPCNNLGAALEGIRSKKR